MFLSKFIVTVVTVLVSITSPDDPLNANNGSDAAALEEVNLFYIFITSHS